MAVHRGGIVKPSSISTQRDGDSVQPRTGFRFVAAAIVGLVVAAYLGRIVFGGLPEARRLAAADLGLILIAAGVLGSLLSPKFLDRLTHLKVGNVELELRQLQEDQQMQRNELDDVRFVLTLLLQESELRHLRNLEEENAREYVGGHSVRTELRKLRTLGLIRTLPGRTIGELGDKFKGDLANIVELTERGKHYLDRLGKFE
jgi:hypothetical protein